MKNNREGNNDGADIFMSCLETKRLFVGQLNASFSDSVLDRILIGSMSEIYNVVHKKEDYLRIPVNVSFYIAIYIKQSIFSNFEMYLKSTYKYIGLFR